MRLRIFICVTMLVVFSSSLTTLQAVDALWQCRKITGSGTSQTTTYSTPVEQEHQKCGGLQSCSEEAEACSTIANPILYCEDELMEAEETRSKKFGDCESSTTHDECFYCDDSVQGELVCAVKYPYDEKNASGDCVDRCDVVIAWTEPGDKCRP